MIDVRFRDKWDRYHFFGSSALTVIFFWFFVVIFNKELYFSVTISYLLSIFCGVAFETLTQFTPRYDHPLWNRLPGFFREWFSGSAWDHRDIEINILGALVFYPALIFIGHLFMQRYSRILKVKDQPRGIKCVVCGKVKPETDKRKWFSVTQGKHIFYACPSDYPLQENEKVKERNLRKVVEAIQSKLSQN